MDGRSKNKCGRRGYFNIDSNDISEMYLGGQTLEQIADFFKISIWTVLDRLDKLGIKKHKTYELDHDSFSIINDESCFWAGFIFGKCFTVKAKRLKSNNNICFEALKGKCDFNGLKSFLKSNLPISERKRKGKVFECFCINSEKIIKDLINNFGLDIKNKNIFNTNKLICDDFKINFFAGFLEANISLKYRKNSNSVVSRFSSKSYNFINDLVNFAKSKDEYIVVPRINSVKDSFEAIYYTNQVKRFLNIFFGLSLEKLSKRNLDIFKNILKDIENNKDEYNFKNNKKIREIRRNNIKVRLISVCRKRIYDAIKRRNVKKKAHTMDLIGCSIEELIKHLESKFKSGMSWENYGKWHIDHIRPLSKFDLSDENQLKEACHYSNLQPLWAFENLSKGAKTINNNNI